MASRNVINVSDVDAFVDEIARQTSHPELRHWLSRQVRRWILNHYEQTDRVVRDPATGGLTLIGAGGRHRPLGGGAPAWCDAALARGDDVVHLRLGASLRKRVNRAVAALAAELERGELPALERIAFAKAEAKARKHRRDSHARQRKARVARATIPVFQAATGESVVVLTGRESLADEGSRMAHCVATYDGWVERGDCKIFSLRDPSGKPRATIEADSDGFVWQIKGFANGAVDPCYRPALQNFIRGKRYVVEGDQDNLLTDRTQLAGDPAGLERFLADRGGLAFLHDNRFGGYRALRDGHLDITLRAIAANAGQLSDCLLESVFTALQPDAGPVLRLRRIAWFVVYDFAVPLLSVEMALPLLYLERRRAFRHRRCAADARAIYRASEAAVVRLALAPHDRLFALGPARHNDGWEQDLIDCPADVLRRSQLDFTGLRSSRHAALRRAMNAAQRQQIAGRNRPSATHVAVRDLLAGRRGIYVL